MIEPDISARDRLVHNERVKLDSVFLSRLGLAILFIGFIPVFLNGVSVATICWGVGGVVVAIGLNVIALLNINRMV